MKRICTLKRVFRAGGQTIIEYVEVSANKYREVKRVTKSDGNKELFIQNDLTSDQIQRDIALRKKHGYKEF